MLTQREYFTHIKTSTLLVQGCKLWPFFSQHVLPLIDAGSLSCHTCRDTGAQFLRSQPKDPPPPQLRRPLRQAHSPEELL